MAHEMVLGEENYDSVANTIIMSSTDSWFLRRWYWEYRNFDDSVWSHHSCFVPWSLWHVFPDSVHVVLDTMLRLVEICLSRFRFRSKVGGLGSKWTKSREVKTNGPND